MSDWCHDSSYMLARSLRRQSMTFMHKTECSINRVLLIQENDHYWVKTRHGKLPTLIFPSRLTLLNTVWHCQCHCIFYEVKNCEIKISTWYKSLIATPAFSPLPCLERVEAFAISFCRESWGFSMTFSLISRNNICKEKPRGKWNSKYYCKHSKTFFLFFFRVMGNDVIERARRVCLIREFLCCSNFLGGIEAFLLWKCQFVMFFCIYSSFFVYFGLFS